jgi:hypothetical protein
LHHPLPLDHPLPVLGELALAQERLEDRGLRLLELEEERNQAPQRIRRSAAWRELSTALLSPRTIGRPRAGVMGHTPIALNRIAAADRASRTARERLGFMSTLRLIGYWRSDDDPRWPDPVEFIDEAWDQAERHMVDVYLRVGGGLTPEQAVGFSSCRICGDDFNGTMEYTDGAYVWPEGLSHYVRDHGVRLPQEFVEHVCKRCDIPTHDLDLGTKWWETVRPDW